VEKDPLSAEPSEERRVRVGLGVLLAGLVLCGRGSSSGQLVTNDLRLECHLDGGMFASEVHAAFQAIRVVGHSEL
jgi:hypothetical protein